MEIDWKGIARTRRMLGDEGTTVLLLRTRAVDAAVLDTALAETGTETPASGNWVRAQRGWTLLVEGLDEEVTSFVHTLAAALVQHGIDGTLTGAPMARPPAWAAGLQKRGSLSAQIGLVAFEPVGHGRWSVDGAGTDLAAELAVSWVSWEAASAVMGHGPGGVGFWADVATAASHLRQQTLGNGGRLVSGWDRTREEVRHARTIGPCGLNLSTNRQGRPWQTMVGDLRNLLLGLPLDEVSNAAISHRGWSALLYSPEPESDSYDGDGYMRRPDLWGEVVLEPCGIQILTDRHLARANDLSAWNTTRLDDTHVLVEAHDPEPWFARPRSPHELVDPDLLDRARRDFGDMILRPGDLETLGRTPG